MLQIQFQKALTFGRFLVQATGSSTLFILAIRDNHLLTGENSGLVTKFISPSATALLPLNIYL